MIVTATCLSDCHRVCAFECREGSVTESSRKVPIRYQESLKASKFRKFKDESALHKIPKHDALLLLCLPASERAPFSKFDMKIDSFVSAGGAQYKHVSYYFSRLQIDKFQMQKRKKIQLSTETINSYQRFRKLLLAAE